MPIELSEKEKNVLILLSIFRMGNLDRRRELIIAEINSEDEYSPRKPKGNITVLYNSVEEIEKEISMLELIKQKLS